MRKMILKQKLMIADEQILQLPGDVKILSVGQQAGELVMWYETTAGLQELQTGPQTEVTVRIVGTGHERNDTFDCSYVGTVQMNYGMQELVWHVYVFEAVLR